MDKKNKHYNIMRYYFERLENTGWCAFYDDL